MSGKELLDEVKKEQEMQFVHSEETEGYPYQYFTEYFPEEV
jgi:hypothetical protein